MVGQTPPAFKHAQCRLGVIGHGPPHLSLAWHLLSLPPHLAVAKRKGRSEKKRKETKKRKNFIHFSMKNYTTKTIIEEENILGRKVPALGGEERRDLTGCFGTLSSSSLVSPLFNSHMCFL